MTGEEQAPIEALLIDLDGTLYFKGDSIQGQLRRPWACING